MGILLLTKSVFAIMIGFLSAIILGLILIPLLKRKKILIEKVASRYSQTNSDNKSKIH